MGEFEERQAYEAGRTGQLAPNIETAAYEAGRQGVQYTIKSKKERDQISGEGAGKGILGLLVMFLLLLFLVLVLAAFVGALISAPLLLLAVKIWGTPARLSFGESYNSSAGVLLSALILAAVVFAAGGYLEFQPLLMTGFWFVDLLTKPLGAMGLDISLVQEAVRMVPAHLLQPTSLPVWPWIAGFTVLVLVSGAASLAKGKSREAFSGFAGFLRAIATVPLVLIPGLLFVIALVLVGAKPLVD